MILQQRLYLELYSDKSSKVKPFQGHTQGRPQQHEATPGEDGRSCSMEEKQDVEVKCGREMVDLLTTETSAPRRPQPHDTPT